MIKKIFTFMMIAMAVSFAGCGASGDDFGTNGNQNDGQSVDNGQDSDETNAASGGELSKGDEAPDFSVELAGGGNFKLSENKGKVVLINIWATWCGPCVGEMPAFEKLNSEYGDEVSIVCVNSMEDKGSVDSFIKENGYTFPIAYDEQGIMNNLYPTEGIPYTVIVGKDGKIAKIEVGANDADSQYKLYKSAIDKALK
ncbi:MAG: TlpA family protein disulfide reductase [Lachnospiraceae bacterium]|nr:TlpA family protein disulfide reductase [Lachnospiraceae bacterium]